MCELDDERNHDNGDRRSDNRTTFLTYRIPGLTSTTMASWRESFLLSASAWCSYMITGLEIARGATLESAEKHIVNVKASFGVDSAAVRAQGVAFGPAVEHLRP